MSGGLWGLVLLKTLNISIEYKRKFLKVFSDGMIFLRVCKQNEHAVITKSCACNGAMCPKGKFCFGNKCNNYPTCEAEPLTGLPATCLCAGKKCKNGKFCYDGKCNNKKMEIGNYIIIWTHLFFEHVLRHMFWKAIYYFSKLLIYGFKLFDMISPKNRQMLKKRIHFS